MYLGVQHFYDTVWSVVMFINLFLVFNVNIFKHIFKEYNNIFLVAEKSTRNGKSRQFQNLWIILSLTKTFSGKGDTAYCIYPVSNMVIY